MVMRPIRLVLEVTYPLVHGIEYAPYVLLFILKSVKKQFAFDRL